LLPKQGSRRAGDSNPSDHYATFTIIPKRIKIVTTFTDTVDQFAPSSKATRKALEKITRRLLKSIKYNVESPSHKQCRGDRKI